MKTNKIKPKHNTWRDAAMAAGRLGIKKWSEYLLLHHNDPLLPGDPRVAYKDFPGWKTFRNHFWGRKGYKKHTVKKYCSYRAAKTLIREHKITSPSEYKRIQKEKPELKLPPSPHYTYSTHFRGWSDFLGRFKTSNLRWVPS